MAVRALILGNTGVNKSLALTQLAEYRKVTAQTPAFHAVDFERDFIVPTLEDDFAGFLDMDESEQCQRWESAWKQFCTDFPPTRDENIVLSLHAVVLRELYGVRSLVALDAIQDYAPTHLVTLIDDVYTQWQRTEKRAHGREYVGQPTLLQLLDGRHSELVIGDMLRRTITERSPPKNWLLAVRHPARVLDRLLFGSGDVLPIYLSFPISEPRRMAKEGEAGGIEEVNRFLKLAISHEKKNQHVVMFSPLAIDELPLAGRSANLAPPANRGAQAVSTEVDAEERTSPTMTFSPQGERWEVRDYLESDDLILTEETNPDSIEIPIAQVQQAEGMIRHDVRVRDYRLVRQARKLVVFNPLFNGRLSSGVQNEVDHAVAQKRPVHVFQDPRHDPDRRTEALLKGSSGALGGRPGRQRVLFHDTIDEALESACRP